MVENFDRVAMHAVPRPLLEAQVKVTGLKLVRVGIPWPCPNEIYEERMRAAIAQARTGGVRYIAFGDLFLEDIRAYRERLLAGTGVEPVFPLWHIPTDALAHEMTAAGLRAVVTCVDPRQLNPSFAGRIFDERFLEELPAGVDPCGERGEFHTFASAGPMFKADIEAHVGEIVERAGFVFADVRLQV